MLKTRPPEKYIRCRAQLRNYAIPAGSITILPLNSDLQRPCRTLETDRSSLFGQAGAPAAPSFSYLIVRNAPNIHRLNTTYVHRLRFATCSQPVYKFLRAARSSISRTRFSYTRYSTLSTEKYLTGDTPYRASYSMFRISITKIASNYQHSICNED